MQKLSAEERVWAGNSLLPLAVLFPAWTTALASLLQNSEEKKLGVRKMVAPPVNQFYGNYF